MQGFNQEIQKDRSYSSSLPSAGADFGVNKPILLASDFHTKQTLTGTNMRLVVHQIYVSKCVTETI